MVIPKNNFRNAVATALIMLKTFSVVVTGEYTNTDCLTSLQDMFDAELNVKEVLALRKYILCPNTTFEIASEYDSDGNPMDGDPPIIVGRPNVHVFCGEDGNSDNNCVLKGGIVHVGIYNEFNTQGPWVTNSILSGLTFSDASDLNILADFQANVIIRDCIFTNNNNIANLRLQLSEPIEEQKKRIFVNSNGLDRPWINNPDYDGSIGLTVLLEKCSFEKNIIGGISAMSTGLIQVFAGNLTVSDTTFVENDIDDAASDWIHYLIGNFGSSLAIKNTCFIQNNVTAAPVINQGGVVTSESVSGIFTNLYFEKPLCTFIANALEGSLDEFDDLFTECEYYDSDGCEHVPFPDIPTPSPTARACWESLTDIYLNEREVIDYSDLRTYILCPDTVYDIAREFDESGLALDGQQYLIIGRPNIRVQCGEEGSSENNCTLAGGDLQLAAYDEFRTGIDATNVIVEGLTFTNANVVNFYAEFYGDIILQDCIFEGNSNLASILAQPPTLNEKRKLAADKTLDIVRSIAEMGNYRNSQHTSLSITVKDCMFKNNDIGVRDGWSGLISSTESNIEVQNTLFVSNTDVGNGINAYIVGNFRGEMSLSGNCFIDNRITVAPVMHKGGSYSASSNSGYLNYGKPKLGCEFIADVPEEASIEMNMNLFDIFCKDFDAEECLLIGAPTNPPSLSIAPTLSPTLIFDKSPSYNNGPLPSPTKARLPTIDINIDDLVSKEPTVDDKTLSSTSKRFYSSVGWIVLPLMVAIYLR